jgi:carboxymethylenebutenolidase
MTKGVTKKWSFKPLKGLVLVFGETFLDYQCQRPSCRQNEFSTLKSYNGPGGQNKFLSKEGAMMKQHPLGCIDWRILVISFVVAGACATMPVTKETTYDPPGGKGPIVILLSGASGPDHYRSYAADVAQLGYYAVLFDGHNFNPAQVAMDGEGNLRRAIQRAQRSPKALPGKAAVIGFSMGGGGALTHAAGMPDLVSTVVVYYPSTRSVTDMRSFVARFKVPILVLAGERDTYRNCCLIESMRAMEAAAKRGRAAFELVIYPEARHGFNLGTSANYRAGDAGDAWQRTIKMLSQYQPLR